MYNAIWLYDCPCIMYINLPFLLTEHKDHVIMKHQFGNVNTLQYNLHVSNVYRNEYSSAGFHINYNVKL